MDCESLLKAVLRGIVFQGNKFPPVQRQEEKFPKTYLCFSYFETCFIEYFSQYLIQLCTILMPMMPFVVHNIVRQ